MSIAACLGIAAPAAAQCRLTAVHDAAPVSGTSMGVRVGRIDWASFPLLPRLANRAFGRTMRPRELAIEVREKQFAVLEAAFTDELLVALQKPNRALIRDSAQSADVILHAELVDIDPGNRFWRVYSGSEWASATVLAILTAPDGRPLLSLRCDRATGGGLLGVGGVTSVLQSGESLVRSNLKKITRSISRELDKSAEAARRLVARRPSRVDAGHLRYGTRLFLERPTETWSFKDAASVLGTFMTQTTGNIVGSPPVLGKGVHTLWLTEPAYRAIRRARDLLAGGETSMWVHPFSYELDAELFDPGTAEGAYAIAVWPFDKPPYYWNADAIAKSTFLRRAGHGDERILPVGMLGPLGPPAVFLFARTTSDGTPLIASLDTIVEVHTQLNGRQIVSRFDLSKFALDGVDQLTAIGASAAKR